MVQSLLMHFFLYYNSNKGKHWNPLECVGIHPQRLPDSNWFCRILLDSVGNSMEWKAKISQPNMTRTWQQFFMHISKWCNAYIQLEVHSCSFAHSLVNNTYSHTFDAKYFFSQLFIQIYLFLSFPFYIVADNQFLSPVVELLFHHRGLYPPWVIPYGIHGMSVGWSTSHLFIP